MKFQQNREERRLMLKELLVDKCLDKLYTKEVELFERYSCKYDAADSARWVGQDHNALCFACSA